MSVSMAWFRSQDNQEGKQHPRCYSIWIRPPEPHLSQLQLVINLLSKFHNTTSFLPHVTVFGRLECKDEDEAKQKWQAVQREVTRPGSELRKIPCRFGSALQNVRWVDRDQSIHQRSYPPGSILQVPMYETHESRGGNGVPDQNDEERPSTTWLQWNQASAIVMERSPEFVSLVRRLRHVLLPESAVTDASETNDGNDVCFAPKINEPHLSLVYTDRVNTVGGTGILSDSTLISRYWPVHEFDAVELSLVETGFSGLSGVKQWKEISRISLQQTADNE